MIDKINFVSGSLLIDDMARPFLPEYEKVKSELDYIARQTAIEPNDVDGWKWRAQSIKKRPIKASPYLID